MIFTQPDTWSGGYYELAILLAPDTLARAVTALWSFADLEGCYTDRDREPTDQPRVPPDAQHDLFGVARIGAARVACRSLAIRYEGGDDWLHFMLPLGSLGTAFPVRAYPFDDGSSLAWRDEVDAWLCTIARHVHAQMPFSRAVVGWDVGAGDEVATRSEVPEERSNGYLIDCDGTLEWFGPNHGAPMTISR